MMMEYILLFDNSLRRSYKVVSDNDVGTVIINKKDGSATLEGDFSSMFSNQFIKELATGTLKFKTNPPKNFVYGVG